MALIKNILWYIEAHLDSEFELSDVADAFGLSRFHLTRLFGVSYGQSLMAYVRARRLSEAAKVLVQDDHDILDVALGAGYGSHEAFTRAFREQFGRPPSEVRQPQSLQNLHLTEALSIMSEPKSDLKSPRLVKAPAMKLAGLSGTFEFNKFGGIPGLWQKFRDYFGHIDSQKDGAAYGVSYNYRPEGLDYMAAVEVGDGDLPPEFSVVKLEAQTYAVFEHHGHVSEISGTWRAIYDTGLKDAGLAPVYVPSFERMDDRFDGRTGSGLIEIWVPVAGY